MRTDYSKLTFTNNFMFCQIMQNSPELCKEIIETILDIKIKDIVRIGDEKGIEITADGRGVRLDVYVEDGDDTVYDIEMQADNTGNLPKRSRYYQGMIDLQLLERGADYNELKKSYIIFINTFDLFGEGLFKYTFSSLCREKPTIELGDETIKIFLNPYGKTETASPKMKEFLTYLSSGEATGDLSINIDKHVQIARENKEWRAKYMTLEWELARMKREGREEERESILKKLLKKMSVEDLLALDFTEEEIESAKNALD